MRFVLCCLMLALPPLAINADYVLSVEVKMAKFARMFAEECPNKNCGCAVYVQFMYGGKKLFGKSPRSFSRPAPCPKFVFGEDTEVFKKALQFPIPKGELSKLCANYSVEITGIERKFPGMNGNGVIKDARYFDSFVDCHELIFDRNAHEVAFPNTNFTNPLLNLYEDFLRVVYTLSCAAYYFGDTCTIRCKSGELGKYTCGALGEKVCSDGYFGDNCSCLLINGSRVCEAVTRAPPNRDQKPAIASEDNINQLILVLSICLALVALVCICIGFCAYLVKRRGRNPSLASARGTGPPRTPAQGPAIVVHNLSDVAEEISAEEEEFKLIQKPEVLDPEAAQYEENERLTASKPAPIPPTLNLVDEIQETLNQASGKDSSLEILPPSPTEDIPSSQYLSSPCLASDGKRLELQPWLSQPLLPNGLKESMSQELARRRFKVQTFVI